VGRRSREVRNEYFPEIIWEHSHVVVDDSGTVKSFCVYDAPSEEIVRGHAPHGSVPCAMTAAGVNRRRSAK
jgi:hypothetical protein